MSPLQLGSLSLSSKLILAPLERVSDIGFRRLCFKNGAALTWTEMIYASDFTQGRPSALNLMDTHDPETITGCQFLVDRTTSKDNGGVDTLYRALERLERGISTNTNPEWRNVAAIDLNFGCPSPNLKKRNVGPSLLRRRSKLSNIFEALNKWKSSTNLCSIKAIGAKIRLGMNEREQRYKVYIPVAEAAAGANLDYLVVHARHAEQRSRDAPTWEAIREVKEAVGTSDLKVIGNGNVRSRLDMERMMNETNCDGVMVGRLAINNPWSLRELCGEAYNSNALLPDIDEFEAAMEEYRIWSACRPAYLSRYKAFHDENFDRIRREIIQSSNKLVRL